MDKDMPESLKIYINVMELTVGVQDLYKNKITKKFNIKYESVLSIIDDLYAELNSVANEIEAEYDTSSNEYSTYENHLQLVNNVLNNLQIVVQALKEKAEGVGKHGFLEHKRNMNSFHDAFNLLMDSATSLKTNPPLLNNS